MSEVFYCDKCDYIFDITYDNGKAIYICKTCNNKKDIEPGTLLLNKCQLKKDHYVNVNKKKAANILAHTTNYICANKNCPTHKGKEKDATMEYTANDSYELRYICLICGTSWINK